jgi:hypothetical protein
MKALVSATLAFSMLGATAASAQDYRYDYGDRDFHRGTYDDSYRHHRNDGAAIAAGIGIVALVAILASQHHHYHDGWHGDGDWRDRGDGYYGYGDDRAYGAYDGGH